MKASVFIKKIIWRLIKTQRTKPAEVKGTEPVIRSDSLTDYEPLSFPETDQPEVSIIIPVYNQFEYTYNCLKSIRKNAGHLDYEIIIADDGSTDLTGRITDIASGVRVIKTEKNSGFLLNCNNAAHHARGKYLMFLNNDTQVRPGWLAELKDILDRDETIGMTGSKLIYPDGRLQEAGGILWNDASASNYGNGYSPEDPEYNYVKEVDYSSGASLMIRHSLWDEIGGLDARYAPAYYEDANLAMEVRNHGFKVVYQPFSEVVHFEGISNGKDIRKGVKQNQTKNRAVFFEKWNRALRAENSPFFTDFFHARERSRKKNCCFVIAQTADGLPEKQTESLVSESCSGNMVKVIAAEQKDRTDKTILLQRNGIEVLYGDFYCRFWRLWLLLKKRKGDTVLDVREER